MGVKTNASAEVNKRVKTGILVACDRFMIVK
jgi:hypothetical protein